MRVFGPHNYAAFWHTTDIPTYNRTMVPFTGRVSSFLNFFCFLELQCQSKLQIQIKKNLFLFFFALLSSFFLCLLGQPELCGSYHILQSCFSFFVCFHGLPELCGNCIILRSCSSFFFRLHGQLELYARDYLLQS